MSFNNEYNNIKSLLSPTLEALDREILSNFEDQLNLKEYIKAPSKHIRPVLAFLYLKALGKEITPEQIKLQAVIELAHNASLIHDDVIDECEIRRNQVSLNKREGNHLAVIGGDFILSYALEKLAELKSTELLGIFSNTLKLMCKGEINQQKNKYKIPTLEEYIQKNYQKTGALFEASVKSSLYLAGIKDKNSEFAGNFGIAFQIRDDILNITKKRTDSDIENGIYTAAVIYSGDPKDPYSGIEKAKSLLNNYTGKVKEEIEKLPESKYKQALIGLVEILNNE